MSLDWGILQWIQSTLVCPALDILVPNITALGNAGAIWLLAAVVLIITSSQKNTADRGYFSCSAWLRASLSETCC